GVGGNGPQKSIPSNSLAPSGGRTG
ncbi:unnamed protein product, partial [Rotaria socialis]